MPATIPRMSKITDLLDKARDAIALGESSYRKAAELIVQAQEADATQQQIAKRLGKSRAWVTYLLAWRKSGYQGSAFERSNRARVSSLTGQSPSCPPRTASPERVARFEAQRARAEAVTAMFGATISNGLRAQLITALAALPADHPAERVRVRLGMSWDELIVPAAAESEQSKAA